MRVFGYNSSMTSRLIEKLQAEINTKIRKESQVVYLLAGIRKIFEQENIPSEDYFYLRFHCDWALHSKLDRKPAQYVLRYFNSAHSKLLNGENLTSNSDLNKISKMDHFQKELSHFLRAYLITDFSQSPEEWPQFLYLYTRVIEDIPLVIRDGSSADIQEVVVSVEIAEEAVDENMLFKVTWHVKDKNGKSGTISILNSFQTKK